MATPKKDHSTNTCLPLFAGGGWLHLQPLGDQPWIQRSKITLYNEPGFTGANKDFVGNVPDLATEIFSCAARSLKVQGKHWVAYTEKDFQGRFMVFGAGDHGSLGEMDQKIRSLRLVKEDLKNPEIVLYEHVDYKGESCSVTETVDDLRRAGFDNLVSSHQVKQGMQLLYEGTNQTGERLITFKGDKWPHYVTRGWNDKLSSLKALLKGDFEL